MRTRTATDRMPRKVPYSAVTSVANDGPIAVEMSSTVRATPSLGPLSARAAMRAPSAAASSTVLRMWRTSANCITARVRTVSRAPTSTNSAAADPRSSPTIRGPTLRTR